MAKKPAVVPRLPKAFSYTRWSSPQQSSGDSRRRQLESAQRWTAANGYELDTTMTLLDAGVSAFKGLNADLGALRAFRTALESGRIPAGSVLVIEHLDRLSREDALSGANILREIVLSGCDVVTTSDGRRYGPESVRDVGSLVYLVVMFAQAHEESRKKSFRGLANWDHRYANAQPGKPITRSVPGWLTVDPSTGRAKLVPDRSKIVRRIVDLAIEGCGAVQIARQLTEDNVPPFHGASRRPVAHKHGLQWGPAYVTRILRSAALVGDHRANPRKGSARVGKVIKGVYPRVITEAQEKALARRLGPLKNRPGRYNPDSIFSKLGVCGHCGQRLMIVSTSSSRPGDRSLICRNQRLRATDPKTGKPLCPAPVASIRYTPTAMAVVTLCRMLGKGLYQVPTSGPADERRVKQAARAFLDAGKALGKAQGAFEKSPSDRAALVLQKLAKHVEQLDNEWKQTEAETRPGWDEGIAAKLRTATVHRDLNQALRQFVTKIVVTPATTSTGGVELHFRASGAKPLTNVVHKWHEPPYQPEGKAARDTTRTKTKILKTPTPQPAPSSSS